MKINNVNSLNRNKKIWLKDRYLTHQYLNRIPYGNYNMVHKLEKIYLQVRAVLIYLKMNEKEYKSLCKNMEIWDILEMKQMLSWD